MQRRLAFERAVEHYDHIRPSYPPALFERVFSLLRARPTIIEVGPGTGQATRDLLAGGATVRAIEPGETMAATLRRNLACDELRISIADFETAEIEPTSADAVFSATAYHWIEPAAQTDRPARLLRPGGLVAIVDLIQVDSPEDHGFFEAATPIYDRYGQHHEGPPAPRRGAVDPPMRARLAADDRFTDVAVDRWDWDQTYSADEYQTLMLSYSGTQMMTDADRTGLLDAVHQLVTQRFEGQVTRPLVVALTTARRRR